MTAALGGDRTMLVWLGRTELDQVEQKDITSGGEPFRFFDAIAAALDGNEEDEGAE